MVVVKSFNSICCIIETKLKTSSSQKATVLQYKVDTGSNGKLMSVNMFKVLYQKTTMNSPIINTKMLYHICI